MKHSKFDSNPVSDQIITNEQSARVRVMAGGATVAAAGLFLAACGEGEKTNIPPVESSTVSSTPEATLPPVDNEGSEDGYVVEAPATPDSAASIEPPAQAESPVVSSPEVDSDSAHEKSSDQEYLAGAADWVLETIATEIKDNFDMMYDDGRQTMQNPNVYGSNEDYKLANGGEEPRVSVLMYGNEMIISISGEGYQDFMQFEVSTDDPSMAAFVAKQGGPREEFIEVAQSALTHESTSINIHASEETVGEYSSFDGAPMDERAEEIISSLKGKLSV